MSSFNPTDAVPKPLVSVIIPTYMGTAFLRDSINSALDQTYSPVEIVVVNDGSPDNTSEVLAEYGDRIVVIDQSNAGTAAARNRGIADSTGQYIAFLDHDDLWNNQMVEKLMQVIAMHPDSGLVYCGRQFFNHYTGKVTSIHPGRSIVDLHELMAMDAIALQAAIIPRAVLAELGDFDATVSGADDWEMTMRIAAKYTIRGIPDILVDIRGHANQQSTMTEKQFGKIVTVLDRYCNIHPGCAECAKSVQTARNILREEFYQRMLSSARVSFKNRRVWLGATQLFTGLRQQPTAVFRVPRRVFEKLTGKSGAQPTG